MRHKIFDLLFKGDRIFVLEVSPVTTRSLTSSAPERKEWAVAPKCPRLSAAPIGYFATRTETTEYYMKVVVETPRVSLGNKSPNPLPSVDEYTSWLLAENLYDPILNPDAPSTPMPNLTFERDARTSVFYFPLLIGARTP